MWYYDVTRNVFVLRQFSLQNLWSTSNIVSSSRDFDISVELGGISPVIWTILLISFLCMQDAQSLHGDIPQKQREVTLKGFRNGAFEVLVATNVAARGLDIPEVDLVIQSSPPKVKNKQTKKKPPDFGQREKFFV